jgi:hypothetical protein
MMAATLIGLGIFLLGTFFGSFWGEARAERRRADEEMAALWKQQLDEMGGYNERPDENQ